MPGLGRYPCSACHYVASNRRMLTRHSALIHCDKVFKCPVCPFVTRYAANWYRHKRGQHGISKLTTCDDCGFSAHSTAELTQHRETEHPNALQVEKSKDKNSRENPQLSEATVNRLIEANRYERNESDLLLDIYDIDQEIDINLPPNGEEMGEECVRFSLPSNGHFGADFAEDKIGAVSKEGSEAFEMNDLDTSDNLRPLRIRRSYNCDQCGLLTNNPREYLYHLRNIHGENIAVHECKYCIYASKQIQKLQRHCNLVHRQQLASDPEYKRHLETSKDKKVARSDLMNVGMPMSHKIPNETFQNSSMLPPVKTKNPPVVLLKCSQCPYHTRNKALLFHHEKTAHPKKRNFRCTACGYVTNDKTRFAKHIKNHNVPKLQCQYCFFKTAYKWNMDRHMKYHEAGATGPFKCGECNFTTATRQSYNAHITHHHDPSADNEEDEELEEMNGENDPSEWEDMSGQESFDAANDGDANFDSFEFSEAPETQDNSWNQSKQYERNLKCQHCDFRAAWPFELKKHEENHRSQKKHPCPLCGMRFEHLAWLTKHLRRIHGENSQAKTMANAFDLMKSGRRRPGKPQTIDAALPMYHEILKHGNATNIKTESDGSMLSSLLKKPLSQFPTSSASRYAAIKPKPFSSPSNFFKQPRVSNFTPKPPSQETPEANSCISSRKVPTCNVCGYKTRWISELQRHMRVHSQEKPYQCHKCKYVCKWKGDLNRHLMKYHGIKVPNPVKKGDFKYSKKFPGDSLESSNEWSTDGAAKRNVFPSGAPTRSSQESPLDLTFGRESFGHPNGSSSPFDPYDLDTPLPMDSECDSIDPLSYNNSPMMGPDFKSQMTQSNENQSLSDGQPSNTKLKYQCPSCSFSTTTASRFHVHIVQHYNKRPFMCSACGFNSNWEWDVTKHIKMKKASKDHNSACVIMTDESGKRNYEKYEKYLIDPSQPPPGTFPTKLPELNGGQENAQRFNSPRQQPVFNDSPNSKSCSYDFRNIGSNFEDGPENIVVTPDISFPDQPDFDEPLEPDNYGTNPESTFQENVPNSLDSKYFYCKHCDFKHSTKRVVVSHLSSHAGMKPFRCRACGIVSNWRHVIVRHVKDVHNGYMNEVEERINYVQEGFILRLVTNNDGNDIPIGNVEPEKPTEVFTCEICPYKCDKEFYMNFHMKQHRPREGAIFKCDYCPYFVKFKKTLIRHMRLHEPSSSNGESNENLDLDDQNSENPITEYSDNAFSFYPQMNESNDESIAISFNQLNQVEESPSKIKRHVCEHCPYKTDNKTQYLYHKQFHRPNPSAPFKCSQCTYWATMQHLLTQHLKVHNDGNSPEKSESPTKDSPRQMFEFFDDKNVPETISIIYVKKGDESVKMFKCEFCPMMNKKKANVRVHQKMHGVVINDGKFACMYCNYQCLNQGGLTNHMKVHQRPGDKDYELAKKLSETEEDIVPVRRRTNSYFCYKCPAIFKTAADLLSHSKFHGCTLPLKCTYCDYRVKQKPHITQHLNVHMAEYKAKRKAANALNPQSSTDVQLDIEIPEVVPVKRMDQMLLLEASELQATFNKTGEAASNLKKCVLCPAAFCKTSTVVYHVSLHGSEGVFKCNQCDYAVNRIENLQIHSLVHPKKSPVKRNLKSYSCTKCPAIFYKQDRIERHLELHGKNHKFKCTECDYSVRFAANLIKHRKIHIPQAPAADASANQNEVSGPQTPDQLPLAETTNLVTTNLTTTADIKKEITYICDRCPYSQHRKDAVQAHQRRHWSEDSLQCPHCDYSSMQNNFLQNHIKLHMQPNQIFQAHAFMGFEQFKIYVRDENNSETLLFDDELMLKDNSAADSKSKSILGEGDKLQSKQAESGPKKSIEKIANQSFPLDSKFCIGNADQYHTDSNLSSSSSKSSKVPVVVLSDIFASDKDLKKWGNRLKIPKLKISRKHARSSSSERSSKKLKVCETPHSDESSKSKKPSLVVKIKVESCRKNKHEKTLYSVSTKCDDQPLKEMETSVPSTENTNDSMSDVIFHDSEATLPTAAPISPVNNIEENTLTSNPDIIDPLKATENTASDIIDSAQNGSVLSQPSKENINHNSNDSFADTVPVVSDAICGKLDCVTELSFKDSDLSSTNGECSNHMSSNNLELLSEEIKVEL